MKRFILVVLLSTSSFVFANELVVAVTEIGFGMIKLKDGSYKQYKLSHIGSVFGVNEREFLIKEGRWIQIDGSEKIEKKILTKISNFKEVNANDYLKGCYKRNFSESDITFVPNEKGGVDVTYFGFDFDQNEVVKKTRGRLLKYGKVVVVKDDEGVVLSSSLDKNSNLSVFTDPIYNKYEIEYEKIGCPK